MGRGCGGGDGDVGDSHSLRGSTSLSAHEEVAHVKTTQIYLTQAVVVLLNLQNNKWYKINGAGAKHSTTCIKYKKDILKENA